MCLYPKKVLNRKYLPNRKNGGIVPAISDENLRFVEIPCGNCMECMKKKSREWTVRLSEELKYNPNAYFITLTFNEESYNMLMNCLIRTGNYDHSEINEIARLAVRRFLERYRKTHKKSIRHWLITELGHEGTERLHLHGIIWTNHIDEIAWFWNYGFIWKGEYTNQQTINYIVKYVS